MLLSHELKPVRDFSGSRASMARIPTNGEILDASCQRVSSLFWVGETSQKDRELLEVFVWFGSSFGVYGIQMVCVCSSSDL